VPRADRFASLTAFVQVIESGGFSAGAVARTCPRRRSATRSRRWKRRLASGAAAPVLRDYRGNRGFLESSAGLEQLYSLLGFSCRALHRNQPWLGHTVQARPLLGGSPMTRFTRVRSTRALDEPMRSCSTCSPSDSTSKCPSKILSRIIKQIVCMISLFRAQLSLHEAMRRHATQSDAHEDFCIVLGLALSNPRISTGLCVGYETAIRSLQRHP